MVKFYKLSQIKIETKVIKFLPIALEVSIDVPNDFQLTKEEFEYLLKEGSLFFYEREEEISFLGKYTEWIGDDSYHYLVFCLSHNPDNPLEVGKIVTILNHNPFYPSNSSEISLAFALLSLSK